MSIRTNPMKAVSSLLRRLKAIEKRVYNLDDLKSELINVNKLFIMMKTIEKEVLDTLTMVDVHLRNSNLSQLMKEKEDIRKRIRNSTQKLQSADTIQRVELPGQTFQHVEPENRKNVHETPLSIPDGEVKNFIVRYNSLDPRFKRFFLSLRLLPDNAVIKKMHTIFWWAGMYHGKLYWQYLDFFERQELIVLHANDRCSVVNKFRINPCIHHESVWPLLQNDNYLKRYSLALEEKKVILSDEFDSQYETEIVLNVRASYLHFASQWMAKRKNLTMLHLGRFHHSSAHHIEVNSENFLRELRDQKNLRYLSLRGISRIFELPPFTVQLQNLQFLDLKACYNLETLPDDISSLRNLGYLNMSQCYLLDRMPKGIEKLTNLKVLKGFVIGSLSKTPCRISDLANLKKLEQLSIHIGNEAIIQDKEFESLKELSTLKQLKISWGVSGTRYTDIQIILPLSLEKLHLEGFPGEKIQKWVQPSMVPWELEVLCIEGGNLKSLDNREILSFDVQIIRLKYLKHLKVDRTNLQRSFPSLRYVQIKQLNGASLQWEY